MSNYFEGIISEKEYFESGPEVEDFKELVDQHFSLTDGQLKLNTLSYEHDRRSVHFVLNVNGDNELKYTIEHFSWYCAEITDLCNFVLAKYYPNENRRFYALSGEMFDFCGAFIEPEILLKLVDENLVFIAPDEYNEIRQKLESDSP